MRILLGFCAVLLIANVAVFFWPVSNGVAPHVYAERADVNPHFLSLNKEVESKFYRTDSVQGLNTNGVEQALGINESCYRLGPFMFQSNYDLAQAVLFNAQLEFQKSTREAQDSLVYRVYLGPFETQAEVDDVRVDLKRNNVLDHFVRQSDDESYMISLGIYTTQETANKAVTLFDGTLEGVKLQQEQLLLPESYWLHFVLDDDGPIRQQLSAMEWGELAVKLGKYECYQG